MIINSANLQSLFKGFKALFLEAFQGSTPDHEKMSMTVPSGSAKEVYGWLGSVPGLRKMIGEAVIENVSANDWTITNEEFESTVAIRRADVERDNLGVYTPLFQSMGIAARQHPGELVADLLVNGFTEKDYTEKPFFSTDKKHDTNDGSSKTFSNLLTKKLSPASYKTAKANIRGRKNGKGRAMRIGRSLLLVVGPEFEDDALKIVKATTVEAGGTNVQAGTAEVLVLPELGDSPKWALLDNSFPIKPFIFQKEVDPELAAQDSNTSDHVFKKKEFLYQAYARHNAGYGLPQLACGSTGADA